MNGSFILLQNLQQNTAFIQPIHGFVDLLFTCMSIMKVLKECYTKLYHARSELHKVFISEYEASRKYFYVITYV